MEAGVGGPIGAAWLRLLKGDERGYGHVDDETPELGMAVLPAYRGRGVRRGARVRGLFNHGQEVEALGGGAA